MTFQASDERRRQFLDLVDDNLNIIKPSYTKGGSWLQFFRHSNSLCACTMRAITNHTLIGKYRLRFFPVKSLSVHIKTILLNQEDTFFMIA